MKSTFRHYPRLITLLLLACLTALVAIIPGGQSIYAQQGKSRQPDAPVGSGFTYQGQLKDGVNPANGPYDLQFKLYDAASGGSQVGSTVTVANQTVTGGLFTVVLDFGTSAFGGQARWLEIAVRPAGGGTYTTLAPRQPLTAVPYAQSLATGSSGAVITGTLPGPALVVTNTSGVGIHGSSSTSYGLSGISTSGTGVFGSGDISIGTGVHGTGNIGVKGESIVHIGVYGVSGSYAGVFGAGSSSSGFGIYGLSNPGVGVRGESSNKHGGLFTNNSTIGYAALQGIASGTPGYGIYGEGNSIGVWGTTLNGTGVRGATTGGYGVHGYSVAAGTGVRGESTSGNGVYGLSTGGSGGASGVYGENTTNTGYGVFGVNNANNTSARGVVGQSNVGYGVTGLSNTGDGVRGQSNSGAGVYGVSSSSSGVIGNTTSGAGVYGFGAGANSTGVYGFSSASGSIGVKGYGSSYGVVAESLGTGISADGGVAAGVFGNDVFIDGDLYVSGSCCAAGAGTFKIDHPLDPENKYLVQSAVQGSDMMSVYSGNATTDAKGEAVVTLPSYVEALNKDFRYQLTIMGAQFAQARVATKIKNNRFTIKTDKPNIEVSWQVTGVRQDPYAKAHPIVTEVDKTAEEQGLYRHPLEYGQPESKGTSYEMLQKNRATTQENRPNPSAPGR